MQYLIYRVKQDKRYKNGYRPNSFQYVSDFLTDYTEAQSKAAEAKQPGYYIGIETITRY